MGYELDREKHRLAICEGEYEVVRRIIDSFIDGKGLHAIAYQLNRDGVPALTERVYLPAPRHCPITRTEKKSKSCYTRPNHQEYDEYCRPCIARYGERARVVGDRGWGKSTIQKITTNPLYQGKMMWDRRRRSSEGTAGGEAECQVSETVTNDVIVTEAEYRQIQTIRKDRRHIHPRMHNSSFLLTGLIECECGANMTGQADGITVKVQNTR